MFSILVLKPPQHSSDFFCSRGKMDVGVQISFADKAISIKKR
jgi:hypothetical protein